jgi:hypothetical protein
VALSNALAMNIGTLSGFVANTIELAGVSHKVFVSPLK